MICLRAIMLAALFVFMAGCKDFLESSIEDEKMVLLAPADSVRDSRYTKTFWWEVMENATKYRLQIVSSTFDAPNDLVLDTLVSANKFTITLAPGSYEWRVRGENNSSVSFYSYRRLFINSSSISDQKLALQIPANNAMSNVRNQLFRWDALHGASSYRFQLDSNSNFGSLPLVDTLIAAAEYGFTLPNDGRFIWRVRGENDTTKSLWSDTRTISLDTTPPDPVNLTGPGNGQVVSMPVVLKWDTAVGASAYELTILKSDSTSAYSNSFPLKLTGSSYTFNDQAASGKLYWKVRAVDASGNFSGFAEVRAFTIQ